nr:hypothetical protein [Tanacetum cinerariifolium]
MALLPRDQRHPYLMIEGLEYTDADIADFKIRLGKVYSREVHRVLVLDFESLSVEMAEGLTSMMLIDHKDPQRQSVSTRRAWRQLFEVRGPLVFELIMKFFSTFRFGEVILDIDVADTLHFGFEVTHSRGDADCWFCIVGRSQAPEKVTVTDLFYLRSMDWAMISGGQFVARLTKHFGFLTEQRLQGLILIIPDLHFSDMAYLLDATAGALVDVVGTPDIDVGAQTVLAPMYHIRYVGLGRGLEMQELQQPHLTRIS